MRGTSWLVGVGLLLGATGFAAAQTATAIKLSGDKPIQIESDKLEVHENENLAIFTGNVNVVQEDTLLKAGLMNVYYVKGAKTTDASSGSQQIDHVEMKSNVYIKSKEQVATGDEGVFDVKASTLVLTGKEVVLTDGKNVAKGCKLTVNTANGKSQLDSCGKGGRVSVMITPDNKGN
ncbi:MAG: LPS ABC transporter substrate-binding protein LptA [Rhizobiales bacterium]|nr:LPS ABC transporter substrate-binding protein LptA [Hyphomicrobiales bacterium]